MEWLERRVVFPRDGRAALCHSRSRSGVVPLVPCDGKDHLRRPRSHRIAGVEIYCGAGGSGCQPGSLQPLRRLGLAGDHRIRPRRHRDRQDPRLYRAGADAGPAQGDHRRSIARSLGRRSFRDQAVRLGFPDQGAARRTRQECRRILRRQSRRLGRKPEIHRPRQHGPCDDPRRGRRRSRGKARAADLRRRDSVDRSGVGRRVPVFGRRKLEQAAFRKDHVVSGAVFAAIQPGLCALEGRKISQRGARHRTLSRGLSDQPRRRFLCQPGRRSRPRYRRPQILRAWRRRDGASLACRASTRTFTHARTAGRSAV